MDKKILCSVDKYVYRQHTIEGVNQQETMSVKLTGSSETTRDMTYIFERYANLIPEHKRKIDQRFLEWFIGFTEGNGSFITSKDKVYFDITRNINDIQVLYYIKKQLGFGKVLIRSEANINVGVFYVTSKENFYRLITLFNGNLSSNLKKEQFYNWLNTYNNQYNSSVVFIDRLVRPSLLTSWISGFCDAEASFTGRVKRCNTSKLKRAPHLTFSVSHKELYILKVLREIFLEMDISELKNLKQDKSLNGWVLHCSSFTKLKLIRNYFSIHTFKTKKSLAFKKWCKIHDLVLNKKHLTLEGLVKIDLLSKDINNFTVS